MENDPLLQNSESDEIEAPPRSTSPTKRRQSTAHRRNQRLSAADKFWAWTCSTAGLLFVVLLLIVFKKKTTGLKGIDSLSAHVNNNGAINVKKSENDGRSYQYTVLENGLQVLLVSDPVATMGAASMDVRVGFYSDPDNLSGLAHLVEHMLFLGTKKYPNENDFDDYLGRNDGESNAYTAEESTNYYFSIKSDKVEKGLDMFSGFFEAPLLLKDSIEREKKAVISEHSKNLNQDSPLTSEVFL